MASTKQAILLTTVSNGTIKLVSFLASIAIARLLTPEEIGLFSVGAALIALAQMFRDLGIGNYLVQEKELTRARFRAASSITLLAAWVMGISLLLFSEPIAVFYDAEKLASIIQVLAINFFIIPLASPILAVLKRNMAFAELAMIHTSAAIVHSLVSVMFALLGYGFMSLAYGALAGILATFLAANFHWSKIGMGSRWRSVLPEFKEWKHIFPFSTKTFGTNLLGTLGEHTSDFVIGKVFGFHSVGIYSRGQGLVDHMNGLLTHAVQVVAFPRFSELMRQRRDVKAPYLKGISYLALFQWPALIFATLFAEPLIVFLFGDQWMESVPFLQLLALAGVVSTLSALSPSMLFALGEAGSALRAQSGIQITRILLILLAASQGLIWVAVAQVAVSTAQVFIYVRYLRRLAGIGLMDILQSIAKSAAIAMLSVIPCYWIIQYWAVEIRMVEMLVCGILTIIFWLLGVWVFRHPIRDEFSNLSFKQS